VISDKRKQVAGWRECEFSIRGTIPAPGLIRTKGSEEKDLYRGRHRQVFPKGTFIMRDRKRSPPLLTRQSTCRRAR